VFELAIHISPSLLSNISLVSRAWRDVVLSTPSLHTYIKFDETWGYHGGADDSRTASETFLDKTKLQLTRSHDSKLFIDIDFRYLDGIADVHSIMKELEPHLHRCFFFKVSLPDWEWLAAVKDHSNPLGPALEQLYLHIETSDSEDQTPITFLPAPCPRLNTITLEHTPLACIRNSQSPSPLPSPDLTEPIQPTILHPSLRHLHLVRDQRQTNSSSSSRIIIPFSLLLATLAATPTLISLHIQSAAFMLVGTEEIFLPQPKKLKMPNLESLAFNFVDTTNIGLFIDNVECERLKTLRIQMDGAGGAEDCVGFLMRACVARPGRYTALYPIATIPYQPLYAQSPFPALRHLDLRAISTTGPALYPFIRVLHNLPHLTALAISSPPSGCFGVRIWELLSSPSRTHEFSPSSSSSTPTTSDLNQKQKQDWILPMLKALIVQNARDVSGHEILRVVRARRVAAIASRVLSAHMSSMLMAIDGAGPYPGLGVPELPPEAEADVVEITYLKIAGCFGLDRDGDVIDELKRLVKRTIL
jgi:hypothetical protein